MQCKNGAKSLRGGLTMSGQVIEQNDFSDVDELHQHQQSEPLGPRRY